MKTQNKFRRPPIDTIADFVKFQRAVLNWKQETLASMAGISKSTVQRVERGERVHTKSLEKLALALRQPADAFTRPREPLSGNEARKAFRASLSWTDGRVKVPVAPFRTEKQLRAVIDTCGLQIDYDVDEANNDVACLQEWLELLSYIRADQHGLIGGRPKRDIRYRENYKTVLNLVENIERRYCAVCLVGTYEAKRDQAPYETYCFAILAIRSRRRNPAAAKIHSLWAEENFNLCALLSNLD